MVELWWRQRRGDVYDMIELTELIKSKDRLVLSTFAFDGSETLSIVVHLYLLYSQRLRKYCGALCVPTVAKIPLCLKSCRP